METRNKRAALRSPQRVPAATTQQAPQQMAYVDAEQGDRVPRLTHAGLDGDALPDLDPSPERQAQCLTLQQLPRKLQYTQSSMLDCGGALTMKSNHTKQIPVSGILNCSMQSFIIGKWKFVYFVYVWLHLLSHRKVNP